jgi:hypothetical protein
MHNATPAQACAGEQGGAGKPGADMPPVVFIYTCRTVCELAVIAPLLDNATHITVCIFYTGKLALQPCTLEPTCALAPPVPAGDIELGSTSGSSNVAISYAPASAKLPAMVASRALALTVWILTFFVGLWGQVCSDNPLVLIHRKGERKGARQSDDLQLLLR